MFTIFRYKDGNNMNPQSYTPLTFDTFEEAVEELKRYREIDKSNDVTDNFDDEVNEKAGTYSHDTQNYFVKEIEKTED